MTSPGQAQAGSEPRGGESEQQTFGSRPTDRLTSDFDGAPPAEIGLHHIGNQYGKQAFLPPCSAFVRPAIPAVSSQAVRRLVACQSQKRAAAPANRHGR